MRPLNFPWFASRRRAPLGRRPGARSGHAEGGSTLPELLLVLAMIGLAASLGAAAWSSFMKKSEVMSAARISQKYFYEARMLSVYRGIYHFVVINPTAKTIGVYADSSSPFQQFDAGDTKVDEEPWPVSITMALPSGVTSMPNPLGGTAISSACTIPDPDSSARWGTTLKGVMATPNGVINSAAATPATVNTGVIVFSDATGQTTSVGIRGQMGAVKSYRYDGTAWQVL
jgi:type II secretory pathway pseudopilin PulG